MTKLVELPLNELLERYPYAKDFFDNYNLPLDADETRSVQEILNTFPEKVLEDLGTDAENLLKSFSDFMQMLSEISDNDFQVNEIKIIGGQDKSGKREEFELTIKKGDVICIVGPTGSGKSRLLADIEWMAQRDTPTKRQILINGDVPDKKWRFSTEHKLVAQLSQNMNFVMDLTVEEFVRLHAESRFVENPDEKIKKIIEKANALAGEKFTSETPITALSGGQSRSLMIADTAILSKSPIILIDEIENAGIDRKKALELLVKEEKIVLMATHDPILALMGSKRIVIKNGGIAKIIDSSEEEKRLLPELEALDNKLIDLRNRLRIGEIL